MQGYTPNIFTHVAMFGILFVSLWLFGKYPIRTAIVTVLVGGWIFLPQAHYHIFLIPFRTKTNAISLALLLGILIKNPKGFLNFRFSWVDLPMICWCVSPFISAISAGVGAYEGAQGLEFQIVDYGIPYAIGRSYFGTFEALKELAVGLLVGALVLIPLEIIELRLSPQMHIWVYGWYPHDFLQTIRESGFRPSVFMSHGLELAIWNAAAAFIGWQLYLRHVIRGSLPFLKTPILPAIIVLSILLMISHSSGAFYLFLIALVITEISIRLKTFIPILLVALLPITYIGLRSTGAWDGQSLVDAAHKITGSADRTQSLDFRIQNETILAEKARIKILFGWGSGGRSLITDKTGKLISVPDGQWIITLGEGGLLALASINCVYLLPALLFFLKFPPKRLGRSVETPAVAFAIFFIITMIDNLFNFMSNPVLIVASGGIVSLALSPSALSGSPPGESRLSKLQHPLTPRATTRVI